MSEFAEYQNLSYSAKSAQKSRTQFSYTKTAFVAGLMVGVVAVYAIVSGQQTNHEEYAIAPIANKTKTMDFAQSLPSNRQANLSQQTNALSNDAPLSAQDGRNPPATMIQNKTPQDSDKTIVTGNIGKNSNDKNSGVLTELNNPYIIKRSDTTAEIQNGVKIIRSFDYSKNTVSSVTPVTPPHK